MSANIERPEDHSNWPVFSFLVSDPNTASYIHAHRRKQQKERLLAAFPEVFEEWGSFFEHDSIVRAFEESATDDRESAEACVELLQKRAVALKAQLDDVSKK